MRLLWCLLVLVWLGAAPLSAQDEPLSDRRVAYEIDARLHPETRTVDAQMTVRWANPAPVPVDSIPFHLYLNAFANDASTFMRESGGRHRGFVADTSAWGGIHVSSVGRVSGSDTTSLRETMRFVYPDDWNLADSTVASVLLDEPVAPGDTLTLTMNFEARLPRVVARTGWSEREDGDLFFMVAQWFPKLGVYEVPGQRYVPEDAAEGSWYTHQFHANSEFYADFGTYDVAMTVPAEYEVGATGRRVGEETGDSLRTVRYRAEDVHDFAWTASPAFRVFTDQWQDVSLRLLILPEHLAQVERHFEATKTALSYFDEWVGPYPYETLTIVDGMGGANGMEYPTLFTAGTYYGLPSWLGALETVTIHEFGHQYFYGLLASNEAEEAWLDEGITSYLEARIMDAAYGPGSMLDLPGLRVGDFEMQRATYAFGDPSRVPIYERSWEYDSFGDYGTASYAKSATVLRSLERHLGWPTMREILRTYYARWRFRHPATEDFLTVAEEVSGEDLDWFADQFIYGTVAVDYRVDRMRSERVDSAQYRSSVRIQREEEGTFPHAVVARFEGGRIDTVRWDGADEWKTFRFESEARLVGVAIDPESVMWLETERLDNRRDPGSDLLARKEQLKVTSWLQGFLALAGFFF